MICLRDSAASNLSGVEVGPLVRSQAGGKIAIGDSVCVLEDLIQQLGTKTVRSQQLPMLGRVGVRADDKAQRMVEEGMSRLETANQAISTSEAVLGDEFVLEVVVG